MEKAMVVALAAGGVLAVCGGTMGQTFIVSSATNDGQACWGDTRSEAFALGGGCSNTFPGNSGTWSASGSGETGGVLRFSMDASFDFTPCCSRSFRPRIRSLYAINDLVISGGSGIVAAECTLDLYAFHDLSYDCSNCQDPVPAPDVPTLSHFRAIFGQTGSDDVVLNSPTNGWHQRTWTGQFNTFFPSRTWNVEIEAEFNLSTDGGNDQVSTVAAAALALLGPVNADGSIGPVFTFPDCPTCTADAPSIGLVDNYLVPAIVGDIDGDDDTDVFDFNEFAFNFGSQVFPGTGGDLDYDGDVDVFDFNLFAVNFGSEI